MSAEKKRNTTIDILRVIGLVLVIAAHCSFSEWFIYLRNFDVTMLVFISGMSFTYSNMLFSRQNCFTYFIKRFRRLVVPVWLFLIFFFVLFALLGKRFDKETIVKSFLLLSGGILFIWVYRIMFTTSILNPYLRHLADRQPSKILLPAALLVLVLNDFLHLRFFNAMGSKGKILSYLLTYTVGYGIISLTGMIFLKENRKTRLIMIIAAAALYAMTGVLLGFPDLYDWKYPPMIYYISYGIMVSGILYLLFENHDFNDNTGAAVLWLSDHCMNIFIWQVLTYYLLDTFANRITNNGFIEFILLFTTGILMSAIEDKVKSMIYVRISHE